MQEFLPWITLGTALLAVLWFKGYISVPWHAASAGSVVSRVATISPNVLTPASRTETERHKEADLDLMPSSVLGVAFAKSVQREAKEEAAFNLALQAREMMLQSCKGGVQDTPKSPPQ